MSIRLGVLGLSEGNGHPFSFAAIINGYDPELLRKAGWGAINAYLDVRDPVDVGFPNARVTHAWCPNPADTASLCAVADIPHAVTAPDGMIGSVDAVLLARDDWRCHWDLARPFLEEGVPVFVDKPLTLDTAQLEAFRPYLERGLLMSCSGYRFAPELDVLRPALRDDPPVALHGVGPHDWDHYGVHLIEPLLTLTAANPTSVARLTTEHDSATVQLSDGGAMSVHCLGESAPGFILNVTTLTARYEVPLADRFTAFRRLLGHFIQQVGSHEPAIDPKETLAVMRTLIAGRLQPEPTDV